MEKVHYNNSTNDHDYDFPVEDEDDPDWDDFTPQKQEDVSRVKKQSTKLLQKIQKSKDNFEILSDSQEFSTQPKSYAIPTEVLENIQAGLIDNIFLIFRIGKE
jgi:hypothetical protein